MGIVARPTAIRKEPLPVSHLKHSSQFYVRQVPRIDRDGREPLSRLEHTPMGRPVRHRTCDVGYRFAYEIQRVGRCAVQRKCSPGKKQVYDLLTCWCFRPACGLRW